MNYFKDKNIRLMWGFKRGGLFSGLALVELKNDEIMLIHHCPSCGSKIEWKVFETEK